MTDQTGNASAASKASIDQRLSNLINRYSIIGGVLAGLIGAVWTLYTWDEIAVRESQKPFLEKQLQYYVEASKVAAQLTVLPLRASAGAAPEETWDAANRRFWELHWGELVVVEDRPVGAAMAQFGAKVRLVETCRTRLEECLLELEACKARTAQCAPQAETCRVRSEECVDAQAALKSQSLDLSRKIRASIQNGWGYRLPND
jgi:hypothetical protein